MKKHDFTTAVSVDQSPEGVFDAPRRSRSSYWPRKSYGMYRMRTLRSTLTTIVTKYPATRS
jgi:hypothetical protein